MTSTGERSYAFSHPQFRRDRPDLLCEVARRPSRSGDSVSTTVFTIEPTPESTLSLQGSPLIHVTSVPLLQPALSYTCHADSYERTPLIDESFDFTEQAAPAAIGNEPNRNSHPLHLDATYLNLDYSSETPYLPNSQEITSSTQLFVPKNPNLDFEAVSSHIIEAMIRLPSLSLNRAALLCLLQQSITLSNAVQVLLVDSMPPWRKHRESVFGSYDSNL